MASMVDQILAAAFRANQIASLDSLKNVVETKAGFKNLSAQQQKEVADILGLAHLAKLSLEKAARYFLESKNIAHLQSVFDLGLRHGKYLLVKFLIDKGLQITKEEYSVFLKQKALPYVPLYRDDKNGFSVDEKILDMILGEIPELREKVLADTVELLEKAGSTNVIIKFILAHYAKNQKLIQRYEQDFNQKASGGRQLIGQVVGAYCRKTGLELVKALQTGDQDNYFPSVASIFLVKDGSRKIVLKENLRLHQDYSRLDGYSMEKEILEIVQHENIVRYPGSVKMGDMEFLVLEFMPGVTLERYVKPDNLLPAEKVVEIIKILADVIDYLHSKNIISMDIKDKNVMYDGDKPILFDFGVSQISQKPYITSLLTTPEYTTPEMALSFRAYPSTDVFQLGLLFYKLLVGKNPFVRYDLYDFVETEEYRESCIIKFVLPMLFKPLDRTPEILRKNPAIVELLEVMLAKDYQKRPEPREIIERLGRL